MLDGIANALGKLFRVETQESHCFHDPQKLRVMITVFFQLPRQAQEVFFTLLRYQLFKLVVNVHRYATAASVWSDGNRMCDTDSKAS